MNRRQALSTLAASAFSTGLASAAEDTVDSGSKKKGWGGGDAKLHQLFNTKWYYTWSPKARPSKATEFVPMIKGAWSLKSLDEIRKMGGISHLLGYNEPERKKQGNMSVEAAIKFWPQLVATAKERNLKLGSPAPSSDKAGLEWLDQFMEQARRQKLTVDFVALHWYKSRDASEFESFVKPMARNYRKPIWITEFNGWSGPEPDHYKFLRASLKFLERNQDVERYAYFNPGNGKPHSLLDKDKKLTRMGELYRDA